MDRRAFLKIGIAGGALLAAASGAYWALNRPELPRRLAFSVDHREAVFAIASALLVGAIPGDAERAPALRRLVGEVETAARGLSLPAQKELGQLLDLLAWLPTRWLVAGVRSPWSEATPEELDAFLVRWRYSRLGLLRSAYQGLHDLVLGTWYADPAHWGRIGYPGPPEIPR